ncbi:MAG: diguanylate cyclase [Sphingomonadales bacterium]|nr:diguanylate cyclase [Sphingomonadales bacterium]
MVAFTALFKKIFPPVPPVIADDFNLLCAVRMQRQTSWLSIALLFTVPVTIYAASAGASFWLRIILPLFIGLLFFAGLVSSHIQYGRDMSAAKAKKFILDTTWSTPIIAALCSAWCVSSWLSAPQDSKIYYPILMAMGSLTTVYCLSSARVAAILNLAIGMIPITLLMMISGNRLDFAASISLMIASIFLLHMIFAQHEQLTDLLLVKKQMQLQAHTDPLTGLLNRRALDARIAAEMEAAYTGNDDDGFTLALMDLDGFKQVNDLYGHATGDGLLCEIAARLKKVCGENAVVTRQGGDEFAVLLPRGNNDKRCSIADEILASLLMPCKIDGRMIRIGASIGTAHWPEDGHSSKDLFETADRALYRIKQSGKTNADPCAGRPRSAA